MDSLEFSDGSKLIVVDDSLNHHGGVGIDFWHKENYCHTELFMLNFDEAVKLTKWLIEYIATAPR